MNLTPPANDEVELSVFGRGYGEAICVHVGDSEWVVVDSCINPTTAQPAALTYLRSIGLNPSDVVRLVVVSHWDDDHIHGLGQIVIECDEATVSCSAALRREDILAFVLNQEDARGALGSGLDEFRSILMSVRERGRNVVWAKANLPLHPIPPGERPRVVALSPSDDAFQRSIESLIEAAAGSAITIPRRYRAPEGPNGASIAASIQNDDITLLLGADLEVSKNAETGWDAVLKYSKPAAKASIVKVPHHGSVGAHHAEMWQELLDDDVVAIVSPWARGAKFLPTAEDLNRMRALCRELYLTAPPALTRVHKDPDLERMLRKVHGEKILELRGWGHVRARRRLGEGAWRVDLDGDAAAVA